MKPVAVLGSGPAGLLAAHACQLAGLPTVVFSTPQKSVIGGAQFLHTAIPEMTDEEPDATVTFRVNGVESVYRQKVYGSLPVPFTSFQGLVDGHTQPAWQMQRVYDNLWDYFGGSINEALVTPEWLDAHKDSFRAIVSSVPRTALCRSLAGDDTTKAHDFYSQTIIVGTKCMMRNSPDNTITYDGTTERSWYRCSKLFGEEGTEWTADMKPPMPTFPLKKPVRCLCDCYPEIIKVGRFGQWKKGVLIHDGFVTTLRELHERDIINIGPKTGECQGG